LVPGGGDPKGIQEAKKDYELAAKKCPDTVIIGGGYSQGAAITHRAVEQLSAGVKARIAGVVLYGDTQNKQSGGRIKGFPADRARVFCNGYGDLKGKSKDGVCGGGLMVNGGHMSYGATFNSAADWLSKKVNEFKRSGGGGGAKGIPAAVAEAPAAAEEPAAAAEEPADSD
jgi:cutinase